LADSGSVTKVKKDKPKKKTPKSSGLKALPEKNLLNLEFRDYHNKVHKNITKNNQINSSLDEIKKELLPKETKDKFVKIAQQPQVIPLISHSVPEIEVKTEILPKKEENFDDSFFQDKEGLFDTQLDNDIGLTPDFKTEDDNNMSVEQPKAVEKVISHESVTEAIAQAAKEVPVCCKIYLPNPLLAKPKNNKIIDDDDDDDVMEEVTIEVERGVTTNTTHHVAENQGNSIASLEIEEGSSSLKNNNNKIQIPYFNTDTSKPADKKEQTIKKDANHIRDIVKLEERKCVKIEDKPRPSITTNKVREIVNSLNKSIVKRKITDSIQSETESIKAESKEHVTPKNICNSNISNSKPLNKVDKGNLENDIDEIELIEIKKKDIKTCLTSMIQETYDKLNKRVKDYIISKFI
jgi:hypothetical protein